MKIGILTFPKAINYGATLQATALRKTLLNRSDATVDFLPYENPAIQSTSKIFDFDALKGNCGFLKSKISGRKPDCRNCFPCEKHRFAAHVAKSDLKRWFPLEMIYTGCSGKNIFFFDIPNTNIHETE